ncbi:MAG TPA: hypothetical protein VFO19_13065 [Vicinamibacterales bacterium]|nr:hypothetical protein [Vicinamibacterales bacterium]
MRRLLTAFGVDYDQWRALTITALKLDFRQTAFGQASLHRQTKAYALLIGQFVFYTMVGGFMAALIVFAGDRFLSSTAVVTYIMFMVGTVVLLDHNSALTSPVDYPVLGYRPVGSRTYFAAKLANVLAYTSLITAVTSYLPIVALFFRFGAAVGLAGIAAFYGAATLVALMILLAYASMLRWIGPAAIRRALSYVQLVMSFLVYGGYFAVADFFRRANLAGLELPREPWILLFPPAWFASYLDLAAGDFRWLVIAPAALSLVAIAALSTGLGGRLSLDYSERLGAIAATAAQRTSRGRREPARGWFQSGEHRAMALLIRSQFKNDQRFRMSVLAILPLTFVYLLLAVRDGALTDPFVATERGGGISLVTVAVLMFPSMLKMSLGYSEAFRASWVFFASPSDRASVIRASKNVLVAYFLVPYLGFVAVLYLFFVHNAVHVGVHMLLLGLLSHLGLQMMFMIDPDLPFAKPPMKGKSSAMMFVFMFAVFFMSGLLNAFSPYLYAHLWLTLAIFAAVIAISIVVDQVTRSRIAWQTRDLEFQG